jgi:outer membrane receptor for ferrienterochelin and colicin
MLPHSIKSYLLATAMAMPMVGAANLAYGQTQTQTPAAAAPVDDGNAVQEVVVSKYRERAADVKELESKNTITVITASDLVKTPDEDVAASLSRVAGISAINGGFAGQGNNNIGTAADLPGRGQAEYDTIRGMKSTPSMASTSLRARPTAAKSSSTCCRPRACRPSSSTSS